MGKKHRDQAVEILWSIWRGINNDYKSRYRRTIWEQFQSTIRSAANTGNLGRFVNSACLKLNAELSGDQEDRESLEAILNGGNDREILKILRDQTVLIVMMVRMRNEQRKQEYQQKKEQSLNLFETGE